MREFKKVNTHGRDLRYDDWCWQGQPWGRRHALELDYHILKKSWKKDKTLTNETIIHELYDVSILFLCSFVNATFVCALWGYHIALFSPKIIAT